MIAKRIDRQSRKGDYRALTLYIGAAEKGRNRDGKLLCQWFAGGAAEDFREGLLEVELTQALNTRARGPKTYHLVASFHPEDRSKLNPAVFEELETTLAEVLGLAGHQRHCGVHVNTGHLHLHVAYNLIDPATRRLKRPYCDFFKLSQACREIEKRYGLTADKGMDGPTDLDRATKPQTRARNLEARTGQESLFSYIRRQKQYLESGMAAAKDWAEVQICFFRRGLVLKPAGNGLVIQDRFGSSAAKASAANPAWSKAKLENIFGPFVRLEVEFQKSVPALDSYAAAPLPSAPGKDGLFQSYQEAARQRKAALAEIEARSRLRFESWREKWKRKSLEIRRLPMLKKDRQRLCQELEVKARRELDELRAETKAIRLAVRKAHQPMTWRMFKEGQAKPANREEVGGAVMRTRPSHEAAKGRELRGESQRPELAVSR